MIDIAKFLALQFRLLVLAFLVLSTNSYAALTINFAQSGSDVRMDATGSLLIPFSQGSPNNTFVTSFTPRSVGGSIIYGGNLIRSAPSITCTKDGGNPIQLGTSNTQVNATSESISFPMLLNVANTGVMWLPASAVQGSTVSNITNSATYANATFASLNLTAGISITCTYGGATANETIYISTGRATPVNSPVSAVVGYNSSANIIALSSTGPATSVAVSTAASHGTATASGTSITYTPNTGYSGPDTFKYTATNELGTSSEALVTITVSGPSSVATLSGMSFSSGALSPTFASGTTTYTQSVANSVTSLTVTPTVTQANATIKVNGTTVASGSASSSIPLNVGANTISTLVTAQNGTTTNTYTTTVTRAYGLPTVTSISASSGTTAGGTSVTITGTNFTGATGVTIGGTAATGVTVASDTSITATTPAGSAGTASVVVTNPAGSNAANTLFTYVSPAPTITSLATSSGPAAGGTSVVITGTNFTGATAVSFGGTAATTYAVNSATQITATTAAHAAGAADVLVTTANGTATSAGAYTYVSAPTITSLATTSGTTAGGTSVVITGTNFTGATAVSFGGTAATTYAVNSATQITATTAAHAAGAADVVVTTLGGTGTSAGAYTYVAPPAPTITSLSPSNGVLTGATSVVITGTGFTGATSVTFDGTAATSYTVNSATQITATTPAHAAGAVSVLVTTANGANAANTLFTYVGPPTVTSVAATSGSVNGGATVTITGTNFTGATAVSFGGTAATSFTVNSATQITATTPAHAAGAVSILVTAVGGTNVANTLYTYRPSTATLSAMTISSGTLSPTFASGTASYTASVTNATSSITVTPTLTDTSATVTVNGNSVASGSASGSVTLNVGANTINTVVTAQDGMTTQTYAVVVTRAALLAQASFTVSASPTTLNATTTTSTLSTSGGSGTGAVTYAMTAGTCTVSGSTVSAGTTSSETCTVTATKASDGTYAAATATVNITVARRATIAAAATDASVLAIHGAQIMQSQKFVTTQIDNVANHLNGYRNNFNLRPSTFGFGVNLPSLGPASQALYKIKDELTPRPEMQVQNKLQSKDKQVGMKKVGYVEEQDLAPYNDYLREEELAAEKVKQKQMQEQKALQEQIEQSQYYTANSQYERENLTYSIWTAGTIDYANYKTGDNKETQNKLTANGLTMGIDYKLHDAAIVGAAVGVGTAWQSAVAINTNLKAKQTAVTGYGMFGFADHWVVEGLMGYGVVDFSGNRTTSDGAAQLGVNRKGETLFSSGTISKMYWVEGYKVTPFARQDVMHINLHSYAETGAADYALGFDSTNFVHTTTSGGLQVSRDIFLEGAKLTPTAKIALNRIRTGGLAQNIYYADTGAAGGVYTLNQSGSYMTTQSLGLGLIYTTRAGDGFDLGWQGAMGANQYKLNGLRFAVRFAM